jgi:hypothetical protein
MNKKPSVLNNYVTHKATCDVWNTSIENGHRACTCGLQRDGTYISLQEKVAEIIRLNSNRSALELADKILTFVKGYYGKG